MIDAVTISKIIVFEIICNVAYECQDHPVSLWCWPLTCNLEKCYSLRSCFGMHNLERQLWYWHLLTRHCSCNLLPGQPFLNMNIERKFEAPLWLHRWRHHPNFFLRNLGRSLHIWGQIEAAFNISIFFIMAAILSSRQTFLPEVIPEVEYTRKIAIGISDILSFWSTP